MISCILSETESLHGQSVFSFKDNENREGPMAGFLKRYTSIMSLADMLLHRRLTLLPTATWKDGNDRRCIELFKQRASYESVVAMCLTETSETFHHWQIFAGGDSGVCIEFDKEQFCELFADNSKFVTGPINYVKLAALSERIADDINTIPFLKRLGYAAEKEFRVLGFSKDPEPAIAVPFDLSIIRRITFSPFTVKTLADSTREILSGIDGCRKLKWARSTLTDNDEWTLFLERYSHWRDLPDPGPAILESLKKAPGLKEVASLIDIKPSLGPLKIRKSPSPKK
jgi:hypothetical protein